MVWRNSWDRWRTTPCHNWSDSGFKLYEGNESTGGEATNNWEFPYLVLPRNRIFYAAFRNMPLNALLAFIPPMREYDTLAHAGTRRLLGTRTELKTFIAFSGESILQLVAWTSSRMHFNQGWGERSWSRNAAGLWPQSFSSAHPVANPVFYPPFLIPAMSIDREESTL